MYKYVGTLGIQEVRIEPWNQLKCVTSTCIVEHSRLQCDAKIRLDSFHQLLLGTVVQSFTFVDDSMYVGRYIVNPSQQ